MMKYDIEMIPEKYLLHAPTLCTVVVCLAKNNPLLDAISLETTKMLLQDLSAKYENVDILIADAINVFERMISNGTTNARAVKMADADGTEISKHFQSLLTELHLTNVQIVRWRDIQDEQYINRKNELTSILEHDATVATTLSDTAKFYIRRRNPSVTINETRVRHFENYLLHEMVVQLYGFKESRILYHVVYVDQPGDAATYTSPVLDLKCEFKKRMNITQKDAAFTSRVFVPKCT